MTSKLKSILLISIASTLILCGCSNQEKYETVDMVDGVPQMSVNKTSDDNLDSAGNSEAIDAGYITPDDLNTDINREPKPEIDLETNKIISNQYIEFVLPNEVYDLVEIEYVDRLVYEGHNSINIYDKASKEAGASGFVCSVMIVDPAIFDINTVENHLKSLTVETAEAGMCDIIVDISEDLSSYTSETHETYDKINSYIDSIYNSIEIK